MDAIKTFESVRRYRSPIRGLFNLAIVVVGAMVGATSTTWADSIEDYYRGKTVNVMIGTGVGGGYDSYARLFAAHIGKHIPGNPRVVPRNVPGAAGLKVLNDLYNVLPRDGTYIAATTPAVFLEPLFGNSRAMFDTMKFTWLGNMDSDVAGCAAWLPSGISKFDDLFSRDANFGATGGTGSNVYLHPMGIRELLNARIKIITGYQGTGDIFLALRRGEIDASCGLFVSTVRTLLASDIESGKMKVIVQLGHQNDPYFGDAVNIYDRLKTQEQKDIANLIFGQSEVTRPFVASPDLPAGISAALKKAFSDTMRDPDLLAQAAKLGMQVKSSDGERVLQQFGSFYRTSKPVVEKATHMMGRSN